MKTNLTDMKKQKEKDRDNVIKRKSLSWWYNWLTSTYHTKDGR